MKRPNRPIGAIQMEVFSWSLTNFKDQTSKATGVTLGSLAPLLGIGEEIGELLTAHQRNNYEEEQDALGDIMVYLCDYASREDYQIRYSMIYPYEIESLDPCKLAVSLSQVYGKLLHATLKHHQGIRGFDDQNLYREKRNEAINQLVRILELWGEADWLPIHKELKQGDTRYLGIHAILSHVWDQVSHRNWNENPNQG